MDVAASAPRVGGGRGEGGGGGEGQSSLEVNREEGRGQRSRVGETGKNHSLRRKEVEKTGKSGKSAKIKRECERAEDWKATEREHRPDSESSIHHIKPISPFPKDCKQAISYQEKAQTVGFVGTGRPSSSELSFRETANFVEMVGGATDDSER